MGAWNYSIVAISTLMLVFAGWQELSRVNRKYLPLRLAAACFAIANLACLVLPINLYKQVEAPKGEAIIETNGTVADSVSLFLQQGHNATPVYIWDEYSLLERPNFTTLHVFGYGLSAYQLQQLKGKHVVFHPALINTGITYASWQRVLHTGEKLQLQGSFVNRTPQKIILLLSGFNTVLDSTIIPPKTQTIFSLATIPKNAGKAVYTLTVLGGNKTIEEELVPVDIHPPDSLAVLVLAGSPDFESRFLKNWLSQNAYSVAQRTAISKGKYGKWFFNMDSMNLDKITAPLLDRFGALVTDASALAALSPGEQAIIRAKLDAGMGLIVKADTLLAKAFYAQTFPLFTQHEKKQQFSVKFGGESNLRFLHGEQPAFIKTTPGIQALATDSAGQILAATGLYGQGRVVLTTINNAYEWLLAGNADAYHNYWSMLISNVAKRQTVAANITVSQLLPRINQQLLVNFETGSSMPIANVSGSNVYLRQNLNLPFLWQGSYWPVKTGWQTIAVENYAADFYVYDKADWQYVDAAENLTATHTFIAQQEKTEKLVSNAIAKQSTPVPKIYFLALFVLSCIVLWAERKFTVAR